MHNRLPDSGGKFSNETIAIAARLANHAARAGSAAHYREECR